jgi:hypothetical protein
VREEITPAFVKLDGQNRVGEAQREGDGSGARANFKNARHVRHALGDAADGPFRDQEVLTQGFVGSDAEPTKPLRYRRDYRVIRSLKT